MRRLVTAVGVLAAFAVAAAPAHASRSQLRIFQDDHLLIYSGVQARISTLDAAKQMGVNVIRVQFVWRNIALGDKPKDPSNPASYGNAWSNWDSLVIEAHKRGLRVLATVTGPAPKWAAGKTGSYFEGSRYPSTKAFGDFMTAVGRRYSGSARASATAMSAGLFDPPPCTPLPPLVTCGPDGPVLTPPPPPGGDGGGGGGGSPPPPPPSGSGDTSPPPPPGSGQPTPPVPPGTQLPRINLWSLYNEPNHPLFLSPQKKKNGVLISPSLYRNLYRAGWKALARTGHRRDTILIGETLPIGSNADRETATTKPLTFARELLCMNGKGRRHPGCSKRFAKLHASGWAMHPYYRKTGPFSHPPEKDDLTPMSLRKLRVLLSKAARRGRISRGVPIWDTENGAQTHPPDPKGASLAKQARFINEAEYVAWRTPFVRTFSQYLMADDQPVWAFQTGLRFVDGKPKPSLQAYQLPVFVKKLRRGVVVWGHIPPVGDRNVTIHPSRGKDVRVHVRRRDGYFTKRLKKRAPKYQLRYGFFVSRTAAPA